MSGSEEKKEIERERKRESESTREIEREDEVGGTNRSIRGSLGGWAAAEVKEIETNGARKITPSRIEEEIDR
jgi:hypothetical protein